MDTPTGKKSRARTARSSSRKKKPPIKAAPQSPLSLALEILDRGKRAEVRALFGFDSTNTEQEVLIKFQLWARWYYPQYFKAHDAPFHRDIDTFNLRVYRGALKAFVD